MSDKHLTEAPWKTLVVKQGLKDIGLQKALAAYAKVDAAKEPDKALECLDEISELSLKLKKSFSGKAEVVEHLDEVLKECKKSRTAAETRARALAKEAAADGDDEELAAFKKDVKKETLGALARVRRLAPGDLEPGEPIQGQLKFMMLLAGHGASVIIARKVGNSTKHLLQELAEATSGKYFSGDCIFEKGAHTFVLEKVPGGLAKKLALALRTQTETRIKVRVRSADGATELDDETDVDTDPDAEGAPQTGGASPRTAATQGAGAEGKVLSLVALQQARLAWDKTRKTIQGEIDKLETAIRAACADDDEVREDALDFDALNEVLRQLDTRLIDKLDQALNAADPAERARLNQEAKGVVDEYLTFVHGDPLMGDIDDSGFVSVAVRKTALATLDLLATKL